MKKLLILSVIVLLILVALSIAAPNYQFELNTNTTYYVLRIVDITLLYLILGLTFTAVSWIINFQKQGGEEYNE